MIILILIGCVVFVVPARYTFIFFLPRTGKDSIFFLKKSVSNERFKLWEASKTSSKTEGWITEPFFFFLWLYKLLRDNPPSGKSLPLPLPTPHCYYLAKIECRTLTDAAVRHANIRGPKLHFGLVLKKFSNYRKR